jgi:hypothetical protein
MTDEGKSMTDKNTQRVAEWLADNSTEFEQQGISEDKVAPAVSLTKEEVMEALDHLENREDVVRMPQALTIPPQFLLKPGRGWPEARDEILGRRSGS